MKIRKKAKIRNPYDQIPHLTQDTIWKLTKRQENITYKRAMALHVGDETLLLVCVLIFDCTSLILIILKGEKTEPAINSHWHFILSWRV